MPLPSIRDIIKRGSVFENNIDDFLERTEDDSERVQRVENILSWLQECVDHGKYLPELSPDRRALQGQVDYWTSILGQNGISVDIDRLDPFDPTAGVPLEVDCPYPGLKAYDENRKDDFIGREKDTEDCIAHLEANRILMIVGGSGSGKSSLALAGVLPKLKSAHIDWQFVPPFIPGVKPFESLGRALAKSLENSSDALTIADSLRKQPERAAAALGELFGADKLVMLLIDQFEELLTLCQDEQEQKAFSELLYGLVTQSDKSDENKIAQESACRILLTLRTDHLARFETNPLLRDLYRLVSDKNTKQLAAIGFEDIRQAIERPAKKIGLRFLPPTIIDKLASQSASLVDGLPLLQFALKRLWEERPTAKPRNDENGNKIEEPLPRLDYINEESFDKLPDVQNALGKVAEDVYVQFNKEKQGLCKRLMLELVLLDENFEQPLRRRRSKAELLKILTRRGSETTVNEVIDDFVAQRLLRYGGSEAQQLEVAHEAIFRNWQTFREWISGESAKTQLHAIKLIGREALDWRSHEYSPDYLKLAGEPLKLAQKYVDEDWLVDKNTTDYVDTCVKHEREKEEQRLQAERADKLTQEAEIARIQAEKEQVKAENVRLEALSKIEIAEAKAQAQKRAKWFAYAGLAVVIIAVSVTFWTYKNGQKSAVKISLPLVASKLPPWEALDVVNSVAQKGRKDFRYVLANALESMEDRKLFPPREKSDVVIAGQGTAIFQLDKSNQDDQKLKVFRVCKDGSIDNNFAEIPYQGRQLADKFLDIAPFSNQAGKNDSRLLILPFKIKRETLQPEPPGWEDMEVYRLNWQEPCAEVSKPEETPIKPDVNLLNSAQKSLDLKNVYEISAMAFDASGNNVAFSAISYPSKGEPKSTVWIFNGTDKNWNPVSIHFTKLTKEQQDRHEDVVSAVAFNEEKQGQLTENSLITGRLNGALYCGDKRLGKIKDLSPVRQIFTTTSKFETDVESWVVYRHELGTIIARQCNNHQKEKTFTKNKKTTLFSINYIQNSANKQVKPVITYVNDKHPECWIKDQKEWMGSNCSWNHRLEQFAIAADGKHLVTIEPGDETTKAVVHKFSRESGTRKKLAGRFSGKRLVVWPTGPVKNSVDDKKSKISESNSGGITRFEVQPSPGAEILVAAISSSGNYVAWLEKTTLNEIDLRLYSAKDNNYIEIPDNNFLSQINLNFPRAYDLAVTKDGSIVLAINREVGLINQKGEVVKVELPIQKKMQEDVNPNISCLELSPNNEKFVVSTKGGGIFLFNLTNRSLERTLDNLADISHGSSEDFKTACAVDDKGMMVSGFGDGSVWVFKDKHLFPLSQQAINQFKQPVKAVSIDSKQNYVAALFDWKSNGCTANALPGQSTRIWGIREKEEKSSLISKPWVPKWLVTMFGNGEPFPLISDICRPNRRVISIGSITEQNNELPIAFDDGDELRPCPGCASKSKTPAEAKEEPESVLTRLFDEAKKKGAKDIGDVELDQKYGIKF